MSEKKTDGEPMLITVEGKSHLAVIIPYDDGLDAAVAVDAANAAIQEWQFGRQGSASMADIQVRPDPLQTHERQSRTAIFVYVGVPPSGPDSIVDDVRSLRELIKEAVAEC